MDRQEKREVAESFLRLSGEYPCLLITRQSGLNAAVSTALRQEVHKAGCRVHVLKNTLVKKALAGRAEFEGLSDAFQGPTMVFFAQDPVALSKIVVDFSKKRKEGFEIVAGFLQDAILNHHDVVALSNIPSLEILHLRILGALTSSARCLLSLMQEPSRRVVRVLAAHQKKLQ